MAAKPTAAQEEAEANARAAAEASLIDSASAAAREQLRRLLVAAPRFDLLAAVALIARAFPSAPGPGQRGPLAAERIRLRPTLSLAFPTADLVSIEAEPARTAGGVPRLLLTSTMLGLYGQSSPLPAYVGEELVAKDESGAVRGFLDLFHHRLLSLLARVLLRHRLLDNREHDARLAAFIGDDPTVAAGAHARLACAGLLSQQPRSAAGLAAVLGFWFAGVPVAVEQCSVRWTPLPEEARIRLGREPGPGRLGFDCVAGDRVRNRSTGFRVAVGPVDAATFRRFLPDGDGRRELAALVGEFNPGGLDWDLDLSVAAVDLPPASLGGATRLGWDTRLGGEPTGDYRIRFDQPAA